MTALSAGPMWPRSRGGRCAGRPSVDTARGWALVSVVLETGRTHQIRVQFASRGMPLAGDLKYGGPALEAAGIGLWSHALAFDHPQTGERMTFSALPPAEEPWDRFATLIPER